VTPPDLREARDTTRRVARTFALACRLLPRTVRDDVHVLYLVMRTLDDLVDARRPEAAGRVAAVAAWADGAPGPRTHEVELLEWLAARHELPREPLAEFCRGMRSDLAGPSIATEAELDRYCHDVAGTVGVLMTAVLGARDPDRAAPAAAALGMAMQRTNILRDIDEDLAHGRVYLASETLGRFGGEAALCPTARGELVRDQIARADALYDRGVAGIPLLVRGRRAVAAAAAMYREILRQIERDAPMEAPGRAVVGRWRKVSVAVRSGALTR
jgi:phytoene synthase